MEAWRSSARVLCLSLTFASGALTGDANPLSPLLSSPSVTTPIVVPPPPPLTNWIRVRATGVANGTNFGIYLSAAGSVYLDDIRLVYGTNADTGNNLLINGDFEDSVLTNGWIIGSAISAA